MPDVRYHAQEIDYLGFLEMQLRDLQGVHKLAYELIQNADDVKAENGSPGAREIVFDVRDDALVVTNDGVFRERDFERMKRIASGGKREELNTTGAFGVGFISVYQVTDHPEIFSSGRHWTILPENDMSRRIEELDADTVGTRFRLPWATDPSSSVRKKLRNEPINVTETDLNNYAIELAEAVELAALFLKQLERLEVCRSGQSVLCVERAASEDGRRMLLEVSDGSESVLYEWTILQTNFASQAEQLRQKYPGQIEDKRHSRVTLTIADKRLDKGRLYATLPTETALPLPFHVNADFYPSSDRNRIIFDSDFQSAWNRAAIEAAAECLAYNFEEIRDLLGPKEFWQLLSRLESCHRAVSSGDYDESFGHFWDKVSADLSERQIVYTSKGRWLRPEQTRLLESQAEREAADILENIGVAIVDDSIRSHFSLLRRIGAPLLSIRDITTGLEETGLEEGCQLRSAPKGLGTVQAWQRLWRMLTAMMRPGRLRENKAKADREEDRLRTSPIALREDEKLVAPSSLYRADEATRQLFPMVPWMALCISLKGVPGDLICEFRVKQAIDCLQSVGPETLQGVANAGDLDLIGIYRWFAHHQEEIHNVQSHQRDLTRLPMWPSSGRLLPLTELYLPTGFEDPLGISNILDVEKLQGLVDFVKSLGAKELDFATYVRKAVPEAFENKELSVKMRYTLVGLLAQNLGHIRDDKATKRQLSSLPLFQSREGTFCAAEDAYYDTPEVGLLGNSAVVLAPKYQDSDTKKALCDWLGVREEPRPAHLSRRVQALTKKDPSESTRAAVVEIFAYLVEGWPSWTDSRHEDYSDLRQMAWLPGDKDANRWLRPHELYASFRQYLFESQAQFLAVPVRIQRNTRRRGGLIEFLGIRTEPSLKMVVQHLLYCVKESKDVNKEVYRFLQDHLHEPGIEELKDKRCLPLGDGDYIRPDQAFWQEHQFGSYRHHLGGDWRTYHKLFTRLGVREEPEIRDYETVLLDIADEHGKFNHVLDEQTRAIVTYCWERLDEALAVEHLHPYDLSALAEHKVIPDSRSILAMPTRLFFEDRANLAQEFSEFIGSNVIRRPPGAWRAMKAAGVRRLSEVITPELVEPPEDAPNRVLRQRLSECRGPIQRVLESANEVAGTTKPVEALDRVQLRKASLLIIRYRLQVFGRSLVGDPGHVSVLRHDDCLFVVHKNGSVPWAALARELAYLIKPDGDVGVLAGGIKEAISYPTPEAATEALDELGYPRLAESIKEEIAKNAPVEEMGGIAGSDGDDCPDARRSDEEPTDGGDETSTRGESARGTVSATTNGSRKNERRSSQDSGQEDGPKTPKTTQSPQRRRGGTRLVSYVVPETQSSESPNRERATHNRQVDKAGIGHVIGYERNQSRSPKEMPHHHKGFDVTSVDANGTERFIEVKSLSGDWNRENPAALTSAQYELAREKEHEFWLYIVERATSEDWTLHIINDPATQVDRYCFDYGWGDVAERVQHQGAISE